MNEIQLFFKNHPKWTKKMLGDKIHLSISQIGRLETNKPYGNKISIHIKNRLESLEKDLKNLGR